MDSFRQFRRILMWCGVLVLAIMGYKYWNSSIEPFFNNLSQKYEQAKEIVGFVSDIEEKVAGADTRNVVILTEKSDLGLNLEVVDTDEERKKGLMNREHLCDNCGMLFVFDEDVQSMFWMKNCKIALDIMFLDKNGRIIDIKKNFEPCEGEDCPSYIPSKKYRYAIEVNSGWVDRNNVEVGDVVTGV